MATFRILTERKRLERRWAIEDMIREHGLLNVLKEISRHAASEAIYSDLGDEPRLLKQGWDLSNGLDRLIDQFKATDPGEFVPEEFEDPEAQ